MEADLYSLLVMTNQGKLKRLRCPFKAICVKDIGELTAGEIVSVDKVLEKDEKLILQVQGKGYYFELFRLRRD